MICFYVPTPNILTYPFKYCFRLLLLVSQSSGEPKGSELLAGKY